MLWADASQAPVLTEWAKGFTAKSGVALTVMGKEDLLSDLNSATDQVAPDLIFGPHEAVQFFAPSGLLTAFTLPKTATLDANPVSAFAIGKKQYGVPLLTEGIALIRNTKLASKEPDTFSALEKTALQLKSRNKNTTGWVTFAVPQGESGDVYHTFPLFSGLGGYIFGGKPGSWNIKDLGIANQKFLKNSALIDQWYREGLLSASTDVDTALTAFMAGKSPYLLSGPWNLSALADSKIRFAISGIPPIIAGIQPQSLSMTKGVMLTKWASIHGVSAQAKILLDTLTGVPAQLSLATRFNRPPVNAKAIRFIKSAELKAYYRATANSIPIPTVPEMNAVWGPLSTAWISVGPNKKTKALFSSAATQIREALRPS